MSQCSETMTAAIRRLHRKLEIMRMDHRQLKDSTFYDIEECYRLIEIIGKEERKIDNGLDERAQRTDA